MEEEREHFGDDYFDTMLPVMEELTDSVEEYGAKLEAAIKAINVTPQVTVNVPEVKIPEIKVPDIHIPEIKLPTINVPEPKVTVNIPDINVPEPKVTVNVPKQDPPVVNIPEMKFPDSMKISATSKTPVPVMQVDPDGNFVSQVLGGGGGSRKVSIVNGGREAVIDEDGHLEVHNVNDGLSIAMGLVPKYSYIHKFGQAPDFDTTDGLVFIWDGANDAGINAMAYTYSTSADIDSISSSNNTDTQSIEIQGLDGNYDLVTQTVVLTGQTRKALTTPLMRIFRMINRGSTDIAGTVYCYVNSAIVAGVPSDATKVRAIINNGNNQTLMANYTIPNGYTGYMRGWYASTAGSSKSADYEIDLYARPLGQVFQLKHRQSISDGGTTSIEHEYFDPHVYSGKTDLAMRVKCLTSAVTGISISAGFDLVLVQD